MNLASVTTDPASAGTIDAGTIDAGDISDISDIEQYQLALFEAWAAELVAGIDDPGVRHTISTYLRWGQKRRLARAVTTRVLAPWSTLAARQQTLRAVEFVTWIASRHDTLSEVDQHTIDMWFADGTTTRIHTRHFLVWAQQQRLVDRHLRFPIITPSAGNPLPAPERDALVARLINDTTIPNDVRIAGLLIALYAQPITRSSRLQRHHLTLSDHGLRLALGADPIEPVEPLTSLLVDLALTLPPGDAWLFPGQNPQRPVSPKTLGRRLLRHGLTRAARVAAPHRLSALVPPPVLANLIGYNPNFIADRAATLNTTWANYPTLRARTSSNEQDSRA